MTQPPFPPPPPYGKPGDPRAAAKAAKAYAKATRPWYRKKRWWVLGAVALIIIASLSSTAGSGGSGNPVATESLQPIPRSSGSAEPTKADADAAGKSDSGKHVFQVGQAVTLEGTIYTVTGASTQDNIGGAYGQKADGVFVVVDLTIENTKNETKTFMDNAATFIARDGTRYEGSDAAMYLGDDALFLRDMQPDLPTKGKLVFDVPPAKAKGGNLEVADLFGRGQARIDLGLK